MLFKNIYKTETNKKLIKEIINNYNTDNILTYEKIKLNNGHICKKKYNEYGDIIYKKDNMEEVTYEYDEHRRLLLKKRINLKDNEVIYIEKNIYNKNNNGTYIQYVKNGYSTSYTKIRISDGQYTHTREKNNHGTTWSKRKFNDEGRLIYYKNNNGEIIKNEYDENNNLIHKFEIVEEGSFFKPVRKIKEEIYRYDNQNNTIYNKYSIDSKVKYEIFFKYDSNNLRIYKKEITYYYDENEMAIEEIYNRYDKNGNKIYEVEYETVKKIEKYDEVRTVEEENKIEVSMDDLIKYYNENNTYYDNVENISNRETAINIDYNWGNDITTLTLSRPVIRSNLHPDHDSVNNILSFTREYIANLLAISDRDGTEQIVIDNGSIRLRTEEIHYDEYE